MKRIAIPRNKITEDCQAFRGFYGVMITLHLDTNQKWTITNSTGAYYHLSRKGQKLRLTYSAFNRLFEEVAKGG